MRTVGILRRQMSRSAASGGGSKARGDPLWDSSSRKLSTASFKHRRKSIRLLLRRRYASNNSE